MSRSMTRLPSLKFDFIGDRVEGHVTRRDINTHEFDDGQDVKSLVIDLALSEPRTQDGTAPFLNGTWWLRSGSQGLAELQRVLKAEGAALGAPFPGDWVSIELGGIRPPTRANRSPKKLFCIEYKARLKLEGSSDPSEEMF